MEVPLLAVVAEDAPVRDFERANLKVIVGVIIFVAVALSGLAFVGHLIIPR